MDGWYILNIGYCADCAVGHLTMKNRDTKQERIFKIEVDGEGNPQFTEGPTEDDHGSEDGDEG